MLCQSRQCPNVRQYKIKNDLNPQKKYYDTFFDLEGNQTLASQVGESSVRILWPVWEM